MSEKRVIGILSRLDLEWLDLAAAKVTEGCSMDEVREALFQLLSPILAGGKKGGSACSKTVTVLNRVWNSVPPEAVALRDRALQLLPTATQEERIALHWAMLCVSYPFWADVGATAGRLLALQGSVALSQLTRRMAESWGDRSTVKRSSQRIVRSMIRWGTLLDSKTPGVYIAAKKMSIGRETAECLIEALLFYLGKSVPVAQAMVHPALFPFDLNLHANDLRTSPRFEVHRQGLDVDVVGLSLER